MCTKGSGTNSEMPTPLPEAAAPAAAAAAVARCCSARSVSRWRAHAAGASRSQCPNMMVAVVRRPTVRKGSREGGQQGRGGRGGANMKGGR